MTVREAEELLNNPRVLVRAIDALIEQVSSGLNLLSVDSDDAALLQRIKDARGEVRGMRRVRTLVQEALMLLRRERETKELEREARDEEFIGLPIPALNIPAVQTFGPTTAEE